MASSSTIISSRLLKFTPWEVYTKIVKTYLNNLEAKWEESTMILELIKDLKNLIEALTIYMLEVRFQPSIKKKKTTDARLLKSGNREKERSTDMLSYFDRLPNKQKKLPLSLVDVMKFFKGLEVFMMRRVWIIDIKDMELGQFTDVCSKIIDKLPKLLIVISALKNDKSKKLALDFIFSIIIIYRQFKMKSTPNILTITDKYTGVPITTLLNEEFSDKKIGEWIKTLNITPKDANTLHLSIYSGNASSPNSGASATKIIEDAAAVKADSKLTSALLGLASELPSSQHFIYLVNIIWENILPSPELEKVIHSKLFHFTAKGGKARIIANVDWLTQTSLSAFHFYFYKILTRLCSDFTFNHKGGLSHIWASRKDDDNFYSIDLHAATDRMPRVLQARILCSIAAGLGLDGEKIAEHWLNIMDRQYSAKGSAMDNGRPVIYSVGQGMGIFTSWPIMAIMHHYIVNCICGVSTEDYILVGDDLVLRGKRDIYDKYCDFLQKIGMEVNQSKTIISEKNDSKSTHSIEFARNFIIENIIINPIEYGILFAWNDEKTSFESFFYAMRSTLNSFIIKNLAIEFLMTISNHSLLCIAYFFWKYKLAEFSEKSTIAQILSPLPLPKWFDKIDFQRVHNSVTTLLNRDVIKNGDKSLERNFQEQQTIAGFMHNFQSSLVVRTKSDALRARELAQRLEYLKFIDDDIGYMALRMADRLFGVELIRYDIDEFGNPLVPKRAQRLLGEIADHYSLEEESTENKEEEKQSSLPSDAT